MSNSTGFHVRHDLQPHLTRELLTLLGALPSGQSQEQLKNAAQEWGYKLRSRKSYGKVLRSLCELGILDDYRSSVKLSVIGQIIADTTAYYPDLLPEFIHFLYYTLWDQDHNNRFSWSYRTVCAVLWNTSPCVIDRDRLVSLVTQEAMHRFEVDGISFSASSVAGIINWLVELQPPCVILRDGEQTFCRRSYCSVELFALALNHIYQREKESDRHHVILSPELQEEICRTCLIAPEGFAEMLTRTAASFNSLSIRRERGERFAMFNFSWHSIKE